MITRRLPDRARRLPAPGRTRARAFTLLELAVVVALAAALFVVLTKWVLGLAATAGSATDTAVAQRDASYVSTLLDADTQAARGCDPGGQDAPLADVRPESAQLYVRHADGTGIASPSAPIDLVLWRLEGVQLQRAVIPGDGTCRFDTTAPDWRTVASGVRAASGTAVFTGTGNRYAAAGAAPYYGSCSGLAAEDCLFDGLAVELVFVSPGADATTVPLSSVYPLTTSGSGL